MLTATLVALVVTGVSLAPRPAPSTPPRIAIRVSAVRHITRSLLDRILQEADAIWRPAGIGFVWQAEQPRTTGAEACLPCRASLCVSLGDDPGSPHNGLSPIGWIVFDDPTAPERNIYVSYANAMYLLERSTGITGSVSQMPQAEVEIYLGRAMGRALAHEVGHYLLASKKHTRSGLMEATHTAAEFFSLGRERFRIDPEERQAVLARAWNLAAPAATS